MLIYSVRKEQDMNAVTAAAAESSTLKFRLCSVLHIHIHQKSNTTIECGITAWTFKDKTSDISDIIKRCFQVPGGHWR